MQNEHLENIRIQGTRSPKNGTSSNVFENIAIGVATYCLQGGINIRNVLGEIEYS